MLFIALYQLYFQMKFSRILKIFKKYTLNFSDILYE